MQIATGEIMRSISTTALFVLSAALVSPSTSALAWGNTGHMTVGAIADIVLRNHPKTQAKVKSLIGKRPLAHVATWPDCAKGSGGPWPCGKMPAADKSAYLKGNGNHREFHYTDVPIQQSQYAANAAGTTRQDVVQIMAQIVRVLRAGKPVKGPAKLDPRRALWLLAHLVGDIHQPLHVGAIYFDKTCKDVVNPQTAGGPPDFGVGKTFGVTIGGNNLSISGGGAKLHSYWDGQTVASAAAAAGLSKVSYTDLAKKLTETAPAPAVVLTSGDPETWAAQWATEILPMARDAHSKLNMTLPGKPRIDKHKMLNCDVNVAFQNGYAGWAGDRAKEQLQKAGYRLAAILVAIYEK